MPLKDRFKSVFSLDESTKWLNKGNVLAATYKIDKCREALVCYDKAIEANPKNSVAWSNKAHVLAGFNCLSDALESVNKAIKIDPKNSEAWFRKGNYLQKTSASAGKVIECYNKAIEANSRNVGALTNKAATLGDLKRFKEAIKCCEQAIALRDDNWEIWYTKGSAEEKEGLAMAAMLSFKKFLLYAPEIKNELKRDVSKRMKMLYLIAYGQGYDVDSEAYGMRFES